MSEPVAFIPPDPSREESPRPSTPKPSLNRRINIAKQIVVDNYNEHHNTSRTPRLAIAHVYIISFTEVLDSWKAVIGSTVVKGLMYEVTYNGATRETTLEVYKRINTERFPK